VLAELVSAHALGGLLTLLLCLTGWPWLSRFVRIRGDYSLLSLAFKLSLSLGFWCYSDKKSIDSSVKRSIVQCPRALGGDSIVKESIRGLFLKESWSHCYYCCSKCYCYGYGCNNMMMISERSSRRGLIYSRRVTCPAHDIACNNKYSIYKLVCHKRQIHSTKCVG